MTVIPFYGFNIPHNTNVVMAPNPNPGVMPWMAQFMPGYEYTPHPDEDISQFSDSEDELDFSTESEDDEDVEMND